MNDDFGRNAGPEVDPAEQELINKTTDAVERRWTERATENQRGADWWRFVNERFREVNPDLTDPALEQLRAGVAFGYIGGLKDTNIKSVEDIDRHCKEVGDRIRQQLTILRGEDPEQAEAHRERMEQYRKAKQPPR